MTGIAEKARLIMKRIARREPINGFDTASISVRKSLPWEFEAIRTARCMWPVDSGRKKNTNRRFRKARVAAPKPGAQNP